MATPTANRDSRRLTGQRGDSALCTTLHAQLDAAREAQQRWAGVSVKERLRVIRNIRYLIADRADSMAESVTYAQRSGPAETLAAELIPLADACRFLEHEAARILAPRPLSRRSRPLWLRGVSVQLRRDPFGIVLIIGASNYPLFLPGIQTLQAIAAGNAAIIKPGAGSTNAARALVDVFVGGGLDAALVQLLPEEPEWVESTIDAGVNKVILTGSADTGRCVQSLLAKSLTPSTMELSGCDAVFVLESADLVRLARCLAFGLRFNRSATCIAPRRVFVPLALTARLEERLLEQLPTAAGDNATSYPDQTVRLLVDAIERGATNGRRRGRWPKRFRDACRPDPAVRCATRDESLAVGRVCTDRVTRHRRIC